MKTCTKCNTEYLESRANFPLDRNGRLGSRCRTCKYKNEDKQKKLARTKLSKERNRARVLARGRTKSKYKGVGFMCAVFGCGGTNADLHHVNYDEPMAVVPLCKKHHVDNHRTCSGLRKK
jgi:hypothetical protein